MNPLEALLLVVVAAGAALVLTDAPWFRQRALADRLRPYHRSAANSSPRHRPAETIRDLLNPVVVDLGRRLSSLLGVTDDLAVRLDRAGWSIDTDSFRLRQFGRTFAAFGVGLAASLATSPQPAMVAALVIGLPVLVAITEEHRISSAAAERSRRIKLELPVAVEQLSMLLAAGYSLGAAVQRIATRGRGVVAADLTSVGRRVRQGVSADDALLEWAERTDLHEVRRLVTVLGLHTEAGDLSSLISEEARSIRAAAHRELLESIDRRSQLVWIPVTVATLVPGLIFLAVPFLDAISQVTGT